MNDLGNILQYIPPLLSMKTERGLESHFCKKTEVTHTTIISGKVSSKRIVQLLQGTIRIKRLNNNLNIQFKRVCETDEHDSTKIQLIYYSM